MAEQTAKTRVCSVLFLDVVGYSKRGVDEQVRLKQSLNGVLEHAMDHAEREECVVVDTGDGAAITVLGDPERALFVGLSIFDNAGELSLRMGINLGPVSLMKDFNGQQNVVGDGINVAERVMSFAQEGELMVSRSFYEVIRLLSGDYASMFKEEGSHADKHGRGHEVYKVTEAVRVGRRVAVAQSKVRTERRSGDPRGPATVVDAGTHFLISGPSEASVQKALNELAEQGFKVISPIEQMGSKWMASAENPKHAIKATVEKFGLKQIVSGPTQEVVDEKVSELLGMGAVLVQESEFFDGQWSAVCEQT
jgi:hypothetical protein